ncbi:MAG: hypothetical protein Q8O79_00900 [Pseudomonadota bacterium]|nr:hypothetical protein [Pseudomonadota bacterium]
MDDADRAEDLIEHALEDALEEVRRSQSGPLAMGCCLFCDTPLGIGLRWCNADCRNAWQHEQDLRMMRGVK